MDWKAILTDLRAHLPHLPPAGDGADGGRQVRGSLRWLEGQMKARGANPVAVRNIIYRDIGTAADKAALRAILNELAAETGRALPGETPAARDSALPEELELLGRSKKRAYKQFLAGVRAGRAPRLIVTGSAGAGKTVLLDHLAAAMQALGLPLRRISLHGEVAGELHLPPPRGRSYAELAQAQADAARPLLPDTGVLLVRVTADLSFHGGPPRNPQGQPVPAGRWAWEHLLTRAPPGVAVLLALESSEGLGGAAQEIIELKPPTPAEARTYLMTRLGVNRAEADRLVRETGRHLDRLALLVNLTSGLAVGTELFADPETRRLVEVTAALHRITAPPAGQPQRAEAAGPHWPHALLTLALGAEPAALPAHARALISGDAQAGWTPIQALRMAWPAVASLPSNAGETTLQRVAAATDPALRAAQMAALTHLADFQALAAQVAAQPDDARHLPALWPRIRQAAQGQEREALARAVVMHHAGRGEYSESRLRDALFTLLESPRDAVRAWARVKLAESSLEDGHMDAAQQQLAHADVQGMHGADPWTLAAQADALLVQAALARWQGDLAAATRAASDPRTGVGGPRALLWRGLIAKDAGRWPEALQALQAVPASSPLLSARARYQEGDLRLRLGQPAAALAALQDAAARLEAAGASAEERSRVLARTATTLRRLGQPQAALQVMEEALRLLPEPRRQDGVAHARLLSESVPILLALGRPDDALARSVSALKALRRSEGRAAEVVYRERRTLYRVALSYLTRGLGRPYLQPLVGPQGDHPDLRQARTLLDTLIASAGTASDREQILLFDMLLSRALAEPQPAPALALAERALQRAEHAYEEAQARAMRAETLLRLQQSAEALAEINRAHALLRRVQVGQHLPDPGLHSQLLTLEALTALQGTPAPPDAVPTVVWLREALREPALEPFRPGVWREVGLALERGHPDPAQVIAALYPEAPLGGTLRPADTVLLNETARPKTP